MRRSLLLLLALWAFGCLFPPTRAALQWQARNRLTASSPASFVSSVLVGDDKAPDNGPFHLNLHRLSHDYDGDIARALYDRSEGRAARWEKLRRRLPRDATVCALALQSLISSGDAKLPHRVGPLGDSDWSVKSPHRTSPKNVSGALQWLHLARTGEVLEPDNCYWDWMQLGALLSLRRDNETPAILHQAALKTRYNDHVWNGVSAVLRARHRSDSRVSTFEQLHFVGDALFPHLPVQRETTRQLIENNWGQLVRQGKSGEQATFTSLHNLLLLARTMRRTAPSILASRTAAGIETSVLWSGTLFPLPNKRPRTGAPLALYQNDARSLSRRAKNAAYPAVVVAANRSWQELNVLKARYNRRTEFWPTIAPNALMGSALAETVATLWCAALPSTLACFLFVCLMKRRVKSKAEAEPSPSPGSSFLGSAFVFVLSLPMPILIGLWLFGAKFDPDLFLFGLQGGFGRFVPTSWTFHALPLFLLLVAAWSSSLTARTHPLCQLPSPLRSLFTTFDSGAVLSLVAWCSYLVVAVVAPILYLCTPTPPPLGAFEAVPWHRFPLIVLVVCFSLLFVPALLGRRTPEQRARYWACAYHLCLGHLLVSTLLLLSLWSLTAPLQSRFDAQLQNALARGENVYIDSSNLALAANGPNATS